MTFCAPSSAATGTEMRFGVFVPPQAEHGKVPALDWLTGLRRHPGQDHSYWFIQSFMADHIAHHARAVCQ